MTAVRRVRSAVVADWKSFLRRRTAVFFTFFFPVILVLIFGALIQTQPTGGGLFTEPASYYVPGYLAVVVMLTPLSRVGSEVARHREGNQFEKLATTPLSRAEWLFAQTVVNVVVIGLAAVALLVLVVLLTGASITFSPLLVPFVFLGVALFCGLGALIGSLADSQDGVIATSNAVALPLLFLSETFVPPAMLPEWFRPVIELSPLTYFSRGVREVTGGQATEWVFGVGTPGPLAWLGILFGLTVVFFAAGAVALPRTD